MDRVQTHCRSLFVIRIMMLIRTTHMILDIDIGKCALFRIPYSIPSAEGVKNNRFSRVSGSPVSLLLNF
jgi:hypothetical protein